MAEQSFTGVRRKRHTRLSVKIADKTARTLITVGGIGTILAVTLICAFLFWVVFPLFTGGSLEDEKAFPLADPLAAAHPLRIGIDEYRLIAWLLRSDGALQLYRLDTGALIETRRIVTGELPTAFAFAEGVDRIALGFADGSVRLGEIDFRTEFFESDDMPEDLRSLEVGQSAQHDGGVVQVTPEGQFRLQKLELVLESPTRLEPPSPVVRLDLTVKPSGGTVFAALTESSRIYVKEVRKKRNLLTGKARIKLTGGEVALTSPPGMGLPVRILLSGLGSELYAIWENGHLVRFDTRDVNEPREAEVVDILPDGGDRVTALRFLNGKTSIAAGDSTGRVRIWFPTRPEGAETIDGAELVNGQTLEGVPSSVTALATSRRARILGVGHGNGHVALHHVTSESLIAEADLAEGSRILALAVAPKEDAIIAATDEQITCWQIDASHPDSSLQALFLPIWYEGAVEAEHVWQSTGASDDFEPKLGLMPLVFGTLKATFYSMLFGLPIAILAAIFTSEFLSARAKARIKPTVEVMASLPSVVLGFLAALVFAPFVEDVVPTVLACFVTVPFAFLLGAYAWQLLPHQLTLRHAGLRFPAIVVCLPVGIALGALVGPLARELLFAGDIRLWLDGQVGSGAGGWVLLLFPVSALIVGILLFRVLGPSFGSMTARWSREQCARFDIIRFGAMCILTLVFSVILAWILNGIGWDPRGSVMGTYVQRNALIVGFVMGFAIIPIIYTIAEDALSAVPDHLRSASLGAGATPWQTAVRVIVPTAMSGLFSATMIGLGRAVGETMVVLMAAGNTPIMDLSIFNGFRTLSANLATELPEAPVNGTLYRTLFLAALVLFLMTFVVNTVAESVRLRFRKRAFEL
jgi:phosphate transport system permease protein